MHVLKTALVIFLVVAGWTGLEASGPFGPGVGAGKYDKTCTASCDKTGNEYKDTYDQSLARCVKAWKDKMKARGTGGVDALNERYIGQSECPTEHAKVTKNKARWHRCYDRCKGGANGYCVGYGCIRSCAATQANNFICPGDDKYDWRD